MAERKNEFAQYVAEKRTVQVLDVLKKISDEEHPITQAALLEAMKDTGYSTTENAGTLSNTIDEILRQINPVEYTEENDRDYRIKYKGYEQNLLDKKELLKEEKREKRRTGGTVQEVTEVSKKEKAPSITGLRYIHDFNYQEMDKLIGIIAFSDGISPNEKVNLIQKIVNTASIHYETPFYDRQNKQLRFNSNGVFSRIYVKTQKLQKDAFVSLGDNISVIQKAINEGMKIVFHFNDYDADKKLVRRKYEYELSPYYIVVYHDMYYLIGAKDGSKDLSHYRIDLMTDIEVKSIKRQPMSRYEELCSQTGNWDPVKYMSEHLYMGYDKPQKICIKIPNNMYTVLHDWFGNHYTKSKRPCEQTGYDYVEVMTSPSMIVHWALQYAGTVEIMNDDIRERICKEIEKLKKKYV